MAYTRKEWKDGDIITPESLNNMEEGISANQKEHAKTVDLPPGTYGGLDTSNSTYKIPNITVDNNGRVADLSQSVLPAATSGRVGLVTPNLYKSFKLQMFRTTGILRTYYSDDGNFYSYGNTFTPPDGINYSYSIPKVENIWVIVPSEKAIGGFLKIKTNFACYRGYDSKGSVFLFCDILNTSEIEAYIEKHHTLNTDRAQYEYKFEIEYWCANPEEMTM